MQGNFTGGLLLDFLLTGLRWDRMQRLDVIQDRLYFHRLRIHPVPGRVGGHRLHGDLEHNFPRASLRVRKRRRQPTALKQAAKQQHCHSSFPFHRNRPLH